MIYAISFIIIWSLVLLDVYHSLFNTIDENSKENLLLKEQGYSYQKIRTPMGFYTNVLTDSKKYMELTTFQVISFVASISTGLVMGIIRCFEPYFHFLLKKTIKAFYGIPLSEEEINKKNSQMTDTIAAFLNSSLNIELVHIILKAITQECTKTSLPKDGWRNFIPLDQDFDEIKKYEIHEIEIKDPKKWKLFDEPPVKEVVRTNINLVEEQPYNEETDTLTINEDISIEELAPKIFSLVRNKENITSEDIIESLAPEANRDMVFKAGEGQGKSGSFFFFSHDRRFIIKTMNNEEYKTFQGIFKEYYRYLIRHDDSLIARIFGIFTVNKEKLQPVRLILMDNTVALQGKKLQYIFDLKGSFANRESKMNKVHNPSHTLKDINLLNIKMNKNILKFKPDDAQRIIDTINRDVPILEKGNIMDYSLLLAIEDNPDYKKHAVTVKKMSKYSRTSGASDLSYGEDVTPSPASRALNFSDGEGNITPYNQFKKSRHKFLSSNLQYIYHISIIDYLQYYNLDKKLENLAKTILKGKKAEISAVPPDRYAKRYKEFMENYVIVTDKKKSSLNSGEELNKIDEDIEEEKAEESKRRAPSDIW